MSGFPTQRPQRTRMTPGWRRVVQETRIHPAQLILPLFVHEAAEDRVDVASMPGVSRTTVSEAVRDATRAAELGLGGVLLFGLPAHKDAEGTSAWDPDGVVCRAVRAIKEATPNLLVWTDVCLCEYTDHGHCARLDGAGHLDFDGSLPLLARVALAHAHAGADAVAPSDMMDGRVGVIRAALDDAGFSALPIVSYAVKYASAFYGPFRDAVDSAPRHGDRRSHQMDPANAREGLREARLDELEGADVFMVKPAGPYLDVIRQVKDALDRPVAAYQVSGEYAAIKAAAHLGWLDEDAAAFESVLSIRRAGADIVITYFAARIAELLEQGMS